MTDAEKYFKEYFTWSKHKTWPQKVEDSLKWIDDSSIKKLFELIIERLDQIEDRLCDLESEVFPD